MNKKLLNFFNVYLVDLNLLSVQFVVIFSIQYTSVFRAEVRECYPRI